LVLFFSFHLVRLAFFVDNFVKVLVVVLSLLQRLLLFLGDLPIVNLGLVLDESAPLVQVSTLVDRVVAFVLVRHALYVVLLGGHGVLDPESHLQRVHD
jgi:hypothetical protein